MAARTRSTSSASAGATNTSISPPQGSPTSNASSSEMPYERSVGRPLSITSAACSATSDSTQPPDTEPTIAPVSDTASREPSGRGADLRVLTTVAMATRWPLSSISCTCSSTSRIAVNGSVRRGPRLRRLPRFRAAADTIPGRSSAGPTTPPGGPRSHHEDLHRKAARDRADLVPGGRRGADAGPAGDPDRRAPARQGQAAVHAAHRHRRLRRRRERREGARDGQQARAEGVLPAQRLPRRPARADAGGAARPAPGGGAPARGAGHAAEEPARGGPAAQAAHLRRPRPPPRGPESRHPGGVLVVVKTDGSVAYRGTGKRKSSVARVTLVPGSGAVTVNNRPVEDYFPRETLRAIALAPLRITSTDASFDVRARIDGGGISGQAGALRHGISRALLEADGELRGDLKKQGFLTRDDRQVERKKAGLKKARKRPQFSKR